MFIVFYLNKFIRNFFIYKIYQTPLLAAIENGNEEIVNLILQVPNLDINCCDNRFYYFFL